MLEILKTLNDDQRDVIADIGLVLAALIFLLGYGLKVLTDRMEPKVENWQQVIELMPDNVLESAAIKYCVENDCRMKPLGSPINPIDSNGK